ncbi:MarR family winged helix-turn-helix transcriptional regulator [Sphingomonas sp. CJ20]
MHNSVLKLDDFLPYRLSIASNAVSDAVATSYRTLFGLRIPEWRLVAVLAEGGAMSQQALCGRTRMDKVTVSRAAIALAERGLIARTANPGDQRSHLLTLSAEGETLYAQVAPQAIALERRMFADFTPDERAQLRAMLDRVERAAGALEDGLPSAARLA